MVAVKHSGNCKIKWLWVPIPHHQTELKPKKQPKNILFLGSVLAVKRKVGKIDILLISLRASAEEKRVNGLKSIFIHSMKTIWRQWGERQKRIPQP